MNNYDMCPRILIGALFIKKNIGKTECQLLKMDK